MRVHDAGFGSSEGISPHHHRDAGLHEFHYFLSGDGTFWNGGAESPVRPGTLFLSQPGDVHRARTGGPGGRFLFYYLLFAAEGDQDGLTSAVVRRFGDQGTAQVGRGHAPVFEDIRRRCSSPEALVRRSADYRFLSLLCDLAGPGAGPNPAPPQAARYVDEALGLMQTSLHRPLDLDAVAGRLGIDKSHFVRLFKRAVGLPPMRYFLGLRLDAAKHRLRNGDEGLRTIALDLGFHDEFHFSHQFKTHVGVSPHVFRNSVSS